MNKATHSLIMHPHYSVIITDLTE